MTLTDAWWVLGQDPNRIFLHVQSESDKGLRLRILEKELVQARSIARKLLGLHHPDKNPDDIDNAKERFQIVQRALSIIEQNTKEFREKLNKIQDDDETRTLIKIIKI
jgi:hypothetical protein